MSVPEQVVTEYPQPTWRQAVARLRTDRTHSRILGGSIIMLAGSTFVSLVNFFYNIAVARLLGPAEFSHAAAAVTLLMLVSSITLSFQLVGAKLIAQSETLGSKARIYRRLRQRAWMVGIVIGGLIALFAQPFAAYLRMPSPTLLTWMGLGIAFYIPLGARRGALQGTCQFKKLSANFALEAVVKFIVAVSLVSLGYGVAGAVAAIAASVVIAYMLPPVGGGLEANDEPGASASAREGMQAIVFFVGQVIINNIDILMVKHFFRPADAGMYAAIALVGRVLYFASWSIVSAMFPISAAAKPQERNSAVVLVPLGFVAGIAVLFTTFLALFPDFVLRLLFGSGFHLPGQHNMDALLALYAATTGGYALSVVLMAYEISRRIANVAWLQLVFSALVVGGITLFHRSLYQVVFVQLVLMAILLISVSVPFVRKQRRQRMTLREAA